MNISFNFQKIAKLIIFWPFYKLLHWVSGISDCLVKMWSEIFASNVQIPICSKWDELAGAPISVRPTFLLSEGSCSLWYVKPEIRAQRGKSWGDGREIIKQLSDGKFWLSTEFIIAITWYTQPPQKPFGSEYEEDHHKKVAIKNSFKMLKIFLCKKCYFGRYFASHL